MRCFAGQKSKKQTAKLAADHQVAGVDEPESLARPVLSAPPSFKSRVRAIQNAQWFVNSNPKLRSSHPSYGSRDSRDGLASGALSPPVPLGGRARSATELGSSLFDVATAYHHPAIDKKGLNGQPMPLPSPQPSPGRSGYRLPLPHDRNTAGASLSPTATSPKISPSPSGKQGSDSVSVSGVLKGKVYASDLQPLPPPKEAVAVTGLRSFTYDELAIASENFPADRCGGDGAAVPSYTASIKFSGKAEKQEVTVVRICERWQQGYKEWLAELSSVARLHGPHLCKFVGFCADEEIAERILVFEKLQKGSLGDLLFGGTDSPPMDWPTRMKIAYGASQGLTNLHEKFPEQVMYKDFRSFHIQVDAEYSSKLSGYRFFSSSNGDAENSNCPSNPRADAYCAPETLNGSELSPKSNVWSFGVVLLELLSGRQNMDPRAPKEEHSLVKWTKPFLMDEGRLFLIMDPKLQGRFPSRGAKMIADLALQCLQKDPTRRPPMRKVAETVKSVQEMRYTIRFPLKEPRNAENVSAAYERSSSPARGIIKTAMQERASKRSPTKFDLIESPPLRPLIIPPRPCATSLVMEEDMVVAHQHDYYVSGPLKRIQGC